MRVEVGVQGGWTEGGERGWEEGVGGWKEGVEGEGGR